MKSKITLLLVLVAAICVVIYLAWPRGSASVPIAAPVAGHQASSSHDAIAASAVPSWFSPEPNASVRVAGTVTFHGAPVAGVVVTLHSQLTRARYTLPPAKLTGDDGRFDLGAVPPGVYQLAAVHSAYTPALQRLDLTDPEVVRGAGAISLRLKACERQLSGRVSDASGGVIEHARILIDSYVGTESDANGSYQLCMPSGNTEVRYEADSYGTVVLTLALLGPERRDIVLVPEAVITGVAIDENGAPVAEAFIGASPATMERDHAGGGTAVSNKNGQFRIAGLSPGRFNVAGYTADALADRVEAIAVIGEAPPVTLRFMRTATISGTVVSRSTPVPGVHVQAMKKSPLRPSGIATTDEKGNFRIDRVPAGGEVAFTAAPFRVVSPTAFNVEQAREYSNVRIQVEPLSTIVGRVTRGSQPVTGARVCCFRTGRSAEGAETDEGGMYKVRGVLAGAHQVSAQFDEEGAFSDTVTVTVRDGEDQRVDLDLNLAASIRGRVVGAEGRPVGGVVVQWRNQSTNDIGRCTTNSTGEYECRSMSGGGKYEASVFANQTSRTAFLPADQPGYPIILLKDGASSVSDVVLKIRYDLLSISGSVVYDSGGGVSDATVRVVEMQATGGTEFPWWQKPLSTFTDVEGHFIINGLAPGKYALQGKTLDGGEGLAYDVSAGSTSVVLRLARPASINGTLSGFDTQPVVYALPLDGPHDLIPGAIEAQTFQIRGVRPGRYLLDVQTPYEGDAVIVTVSPEKTTNVNMKAHGRARIEGTITDYRTQQPIAGAACHAVMAVDEVQGVTNWDPLLAPKSGSDGRFVLDPAPAGSVGVFCEPGDPRLSQASGNLIISAGGLGHISLKSVASGVRSDTGISFDWHYVIPRVISTASPSPAAAAGIRAGDVVVSVDGKSVEGLNAVSVEALIESHSPGTQVSLVLARGTESVRAVLTVP